MSIIRRKLIVPCGLVPLNCDREKISIVRRLAVYGLLLYAAKHLLADVVELVDTHA